MRGRILFAIMFGLACVSVWLLINRGDTAFGGVQIIDQAQAEPGDVRSLTPAASSPDQQPLAADGAAAEDAAAAPAGHVMPESYRAALGALVGRLLEEDGSPVPGMAVVLVGGRPSMFVLPTDNYLREDLAALEADGHLLRCAEGITDEEGRFRLAAVEPRTIGALLVDPGGSRPLAVWLDESAVSGAERDLGDIILPSTVTFGGHVTDERGEPIAAVRIRATDLPAMVLGLGAADYRRGGGVLVDEDGERLVYIPPPHLAVLERYLPIPTTYTDAGGNFELAGVPPGLISVVLDDPVHLTTVRPPVPSGAPGTRRDLGTLVMPDGATLTGKVLTAEGNPAPGAEVLAGNRMSVAPVTILKGPVVTDERGAFTFTGLRPDTGHVVARAAGGDAWIPSEAVRVGEGEVFVHLPGERRLTVHVTDEGGQPVRAVRFFGRVLSALNLGDEMVPDLAVPPRPLTDRVEETEAGAYHITRLDPVPWELIVQAPGFGAERMEVDLSVETPDLAVTLQGATSLVVVVRQQGNGEPLAWARVTAGQADEVFPVTGTRTDEKGRATLRGLPPGLTRVTATYPGLAVTRETVELPSDEELVLELLAGGRVAGVAVENGHPPIAPVWVTLEPTGDQAGDAQVPRATVTLPDGSFVFEDVEPGPSRLMAKERHNPSASLSDLVSVFSFDTPLARQDIDVPAGGEVEALLILGSAYDDIETGRIRGSLVVNGAPADGWRVYTWGRINRSTSTDRNGAFDLGRVAAGKVRLRIGPPGGFFATNTVTIHEVELAEGEQAFVDLSLVTGSTSGHVVAAGNGRRLDGVRVWTSSRESSKGRAGRVGSITDANGAFRIEPLLGGRYVVHASAMGYARSTSEEFEVRELGHTSGIEIRMAPAIRVAGVVTAAGLAGTQNWMWLSASLNDSDNRQSTRVSPGTMAFEFDELAPGEVVFTFHSSQGLEFEPIERTIQGDTDELQLDFVPAPPESDEEDQS